MSESRYQVQTWARKNRAALATLGRPLDELAEVFARLATDAMDANAELGFWDMQTVDGTDAEVIRRRGQELHDAANVLHHLPPVPDGPAQHLLETALTRYTEVGAMLGMDEVAGRELFTTWSEASDAYTRFAQRLVVASGSATPDP